MSSTPPKQPFDAASRTADGMELPPPPADIPGLSSEELKQLQGLLAKLYLRRSEINENAEHVMRLTKPIGEACGQIVQQCRGLNTEFEKLSNPQKTGLLDSCIQTLSVQEDRQAIDAFPGQLKELATKVTNLNNSISIDVNNELTLSRLDHMAAIFNKAISLNSISSDQGESFGGGRAGHLKEELGGWLNQVADGLGLPKVYKEPTSISGQSISAQASGNTEPSKHVGIYAELIGLREQLTDPKSTLGTLNSSLEVLQKTTGELCKAVQSQNATLIDAKGASVTFRLDTLAQTVGRLEQRLDPMPVFYQRLSNSVDRIGRSFVGLWIVIVVGSIVTTFFLSRGYAGYHELRTAHEQQHVALVQQHTELMQCKEKLDDLAKRPLPIDPVPKLNERISQLEETLATRNKEWLSKLEICRRPEKFGPTIK